MKKMIKIRCTTLVVLIILMTSNSIYAQLQTDKKFGFKINIPNNWTKKSHMDGTDKIYDYASPDQNAAIQLRVFEATPQVTLDILCQAYESSYLPAGTRKESLVDHTSVNGIPGKQGLYVLTYDNVDVTIANFYVVQNNKGYVLSAIIPSIMIEQKGAEVKQITQSFVIDGYELRAEASQENNKPASGLLGGISQKLSQSGSQATTSNGNIAGKYTFVSRSDGPSRTNYHYIEIRSDGTYAETYQPKNSGNYVGGNEGTWKLNGSTLVFSHYNSTVTDTYTWRNNELTRESDGIIFLFRK